jgi:hypothetical protein
VAKVSINPRIRFYGVEHGNAGETIERGEAGAYAGFQQR